MILVDTSVWIDHFDKHDPLLFSLLGDESVAMHPFVLGELAMGNLVRREAVLVMLNQLPQVILGEDAEVLSFIEEQTLFGQGIGYIDAHLLVSARLTPGTLLWTRDRRLHAAAIRFSLAHPVA